jgi:hypothetical protein
MEGGSGLPRSACSRSSRITNQTPMKIPTWIHPEPLEVDVEVSTEDITRALEENPDTPAAAFQMLNRVAAVLKSMTPEIIAGLKPSQREVVEKFLTDQAARFRCENVKWWHRRDQAPIQTRTLSPVATHDLIGFCFRVEL